MNIKYLMMAWVVISIIVVFIFVGSLSMLVKEAGGVKNIIIETGREINDISEKINEGKRTEDTQANGSEE